MYVFLRLRGMFMIDEVRVKGLSIRARHKSHAIA